MVCVFFRLYLADYCGGGAWCVCDGELGLVGAWVGARGVWGYVKKGGRKVKIPIDARAVAGVVVGA